MQHRKVSALQSPGIKAAHDIWPGRWQRRRRHSKTFQGRHVYSLHGGCSIAPAHRRQRPSNLSRTSGSHRQQRARRSWVQYINDAIMGRASSHMAEIHLSPVAQTSNVLPQSSILTAQALQGASPWRRRARPGSRSRAGPSRHDITHRARGHGSCRSCCMRHQGHGWRNIADRPIASSSIKLNLSEDTVQQNESRHDATMQKQLDHAGIPRS